MVQKVTIFGQFLKVLGDKLSHKSSPNVWWLSGYLANITGLVPYWDNFRKMGGSPGLVVMGEDSCPEGCGFKSQHHKLAWHFFTYICWKNCNVCLFEYTKNKQKEAGVGPLKKQTWRSDIWRSISSKIDVFSAAESLPEPDWNDDSDGSDESTISPDKKLKRRSRSTCCVNRICYKTVIIIYDSRVLPD